MTPADEFASKGNGCSASDDAIEKHEPESSSLSVRPFKLRVLSKSEIRNRLVSELNAMETSSSVGEKRVCPLSSNSDENNSNEASSSKKARYKTEESDEINCTDTVEGSNAGDACEENQINVEPATSTISSDDAIEKHGPESFSPSVRPFKLDVPSKSEIRNRLLSELNAMETSSSVGEKHLCPLSLNSNENDSNEASSSKKSKYKTEESDEINCTDAVGGPNASDACKENHINKESATSTISGTGRPQNGMESQVEKADSVGNTANVFVIKTEPTDTDAPTCAPSVSATSADTRVKPADRVKKEEATSTSRESCKFGIRCYRRNPMHRIEEAHPGDHDYRRPNYPPPPVGTPDCPYGDACYRRNPIHFEQFSHPPEI